MVRTYPILPRDFPRRKARLSPREHETLGHLKKGWAEKQVAAAMGISPNTVHVYVKSIYRFFDARSRPELFAILLAQSEARQELPQLRLEQA